MQFLVRYVARKEQEFTTSVNWRMTLIFSVPDQIKQRLREKDPTAETVSCRHSCPKPAHTFLRNCTKGDERELSGGTGRRQTLERK